MNMDRIKKLEPFWGCWYIKKPLGEGGFGAVLEVERKEFGNTFSAAVKYISIPASEADYKEALSDGMSQEGTTAYFRGMVEDISKEFALMDKVKGHTNIVDYSDHMVLQRKDEFGWDILIRMELLMPLNDFVVNNPLDETDIIRMGVHICRALEVCRKYNIIHRDIKPANIFLSENGDFKLGDFGIARVAERSNGASTKIGTMNYLAPEVYRGKRYDHTVDIYSLGLVLYRFLNHGRMPFFPPYPQDISFSDKEEAMAKRMGGQEPLPDPDCTNAELVRIVKKACAYLPADRYQQPEEMRMELQRLLGEFVPHESQATTQSAQQTPPPAQQTPPPVQQTPPPPVQQTPPPAPQTPPPVQQTPPPAQQTPPPAWQTPPPVQQTPPPVQQTPPPGQQMPLPDAAQYRGKQNLHKDVMAYAKSNRIGMGWYTFLVYVPFFVTPIFGILVGLVYLMSPMDAYSILLGIAGFIYGALIIAASIWAFVIHKQLKNFKEIAPKAVTWYFIAKIVIAVVYHLVYIFELFTYGLYRLIIEIPYLICIIVFMCVSIPYFKNRKELFRY